MGILLYTAMLLGWGYGAGRLARVGFGTGIAVAMASAVVLLYAAVYVHMLSPMMVVLCSMGGAGLLYWFYENRLAFRSKRELLARVKALPPAGWVFVLVLLALYLLTRYWPLLGWDDFSHWGIQSKETWLNRTLLNSTHAVYAYNYPPGTSLWHSIAFFVLGRGYDESDALLANALLSFAPAFVMLDAIKSLRRFGWALCAGIVFFVYSLTFLLSYAYYSLMVDHILALYMAAALIVYCFDSDKRRGLLLALPMLMALVVIKHSGTMLALIVWLTLGVDYLRRGHISLKQIVLCAMILVAILGVRYSWSVYVDSVQGGGFVVRGLSAGEVMTALTDRATDVQKQVRSAYYNALVHGEKGIGVYRSYTAGVFALVVLLTVFLVWRAQHKEKRRELLCIAGLLAFGFAIYAMGLFIVYLQYFNAWEGVRLASYERYLGTYVLAVLVWLVALLFERLAAWPGLLRGQRIAAVILLLTLGGACLASSSEEEGLFITYPINGELNYTYQHLMTVRKEVDASMVEVRPLLKREDKVYIIWVDTNGYQFYLLNYLVLPSKSSKSCWQWGKPYFDDDQWTCNKPRHEFLASMQEYTYLFVAKGDKQFWDFAGPLFLTPNPQDYRLFTITPKGFVAVEASKRKDTH